MTKFCLLVAALAGSASAFAPESGRPSTALKAGYVGGEGPEPIPFSSVGTSVNFDPCGFAEVRKITIDWSMQNSLAALFAEIIGFWGCTNAVVVFTKIL